MQSVVISTYVGVRIHIWRIYEQTLSTENLLQVGWIISNYKVKSYTPSGWYAAPKAKTECFFSLIIQNYFWWDLNLINSEKLKNAKKKFMWRASNSLAYDEFLENVNAEKSMELTFSKRIDFSRIIQSVLVLASFPLHTRLLFLTKSCQIMNFNEKEKIQEFWNYGRIQQISSVNKSYYQSFALWKSYIYTVAVYVLHAYSYLPLKFRWKSAENWYPKQSYP